MNETYDCKAKQELLIKYNIKFKAWFDTENWFYAPLNRPVVPFSIVVFYLLFCLWIGPLLMKNRAPFRLKGTIAVFDFIMSAFSLYNVILASYHIYSIGWAAQCAPSLSRRIELVALEPYAAEKYIICYYYLKIFELTDTIFLVLRKKSDQISFLHVFHHTAVVLVSWHAAFCDFATICWVIVFLTNSFIHVQMYGYYGIVVCGYKVPSKLKKLLTKQQILQFVIQLLYLFIMYQIGCLTNSSTIVWVIPILFVLLLLFINFYIKTFMKKSQ